MTRATWSVFAAVATLTAWVEQTLDGDSADVAAPGAATAVPVPTPKRGPSSPVSP